MGLTLLAANNGVGAGPPGYTLSDTGTYLAYYDQGLISIEDRNSSSTSLAQRLQRNN